MYTNGYTGQKYLSILGFKDAAGRSYAFLESEFADQSEHVTLAALSFEPNVVMSETDTSYGRAYGWEGAQPPQLADLARQCCALIDRARAAGVTVDDGNVVDLCADHLTAVPLLEIRCAIARSAYGAQFPRATA